MVKTSVGVWSRSIADWDLQRETLWEMMERLATYFLLLTLVSLAEADFTVSSKRDMRWVGVLDHIIIFLTPATLPPGDVGSSLSLPLMVSLVQLSLWSSSISQPSAQLRSSGLEIWREIARYRSSFFITNWSERRCADGFVESAVGHYFWWILPLVLLILSTTVAKLA